jgi:hypothetical protein
MKITRLVPIVALAIFVSGCSASQETATAPAEPVEAPAPVGMSKEEACVELVSGIGDFTNIIGETALEFQFDDNGNVLPPSAKIQALVDDLTASLNEVSQNAPDEEIKTLADLFVTGLAAYHSNTMNQEPTDASFDALLTNSENIYATCS